MKQNNDSLIASACEMELQNKMHKYEKVTQAFS